MDKLEEEDMMEKRSFVKNNFLINYIPESIKEQ